MKLREARESTGMTQEQAAEKLGVSRTTITMWETSASSPTAKMLPKVARLYGCTIDDLFQGREDNAEQ